MKKIMPPFLNWNTESHFGKPKNVAILLQDETLIISLI